MMRLSEQSHGHQKTIILKHWSACVLFCSKNPTEVRLSMVDALVGNSSGRRTIIRNDITSGSTSAAQGGATAVRQLTVDVSASSKGKRSSKGRIKSSTVAIYVSIFALLVAVIGVGYRAPQQTATIASAAPVSSAVTSNAEEASVNEVVATNIAASVAQAADLAIAPNVAERAVSTRVQNEYQSVGGDESAISKPAIVQLTTASRAVSTYTVQAGDTAQTVAARYSLSTDTIKWANNLTSDALTVGSTLQILPRDGILYTVKDGDTVESIANKYKADASLITTYNDLELNGATTGLKIIIPSGVLPETERPGYVAPQPAVTTTTGTFITGYSSGFSGTKTWFISKGIGAAGGYAYGNCTAYVYWRRAQLNMPIGSNWGNAGTWATYARSAGYQVDRTPSAGAVIQDSGHVAIVEEVLANGDLSLSEMNAYVSGGGFNVVSGRILPAAQVGQYYYIH